MNNKLLPDEVVRVLSDYLHMRKEVDCVKTGKRFEPCDVLELILKNDPDKINKGIMQMICKDIKYLDGKRGSIDKMFDRNARYFSEQIATESAPGNELLRQMLVKCRENENSYDDY